MEISLKNTGKDGWTCGTQIRLFQIFWLTHWCRKTTFRSRQRGDFPPPSSTTLFNLKISTHFFQIKLPEPSSGFSFSTPTSKDDAAPASDIFGNFGKKVSEPAKTADTPFVFGKPAENSEKVPEKKAEPVKAAEAPKPTPTVSTTATTTEKTTESNSAKRKKVDDEDKPAVKPLFPALPEVNFHRIFMDFSLYIISSFFLFSLLEFFLYVFRKDEKYIKNYRKISLKY